MLVNLYIKARTELPDVDGVSDIKLYEYVIDWANENIDVIAHDKNDIDWFVDYVGVYREEKLWMKN